MPRFPRNESSPIDLVQIEGLVVLRIIKHAQEEGGTSSEAHGVLLGLVVDRKLEITNSFPLPRHNEDDEVDDSEHQVAMMRHLRNVNVDHLTVGWYQSNPLGSILSKLETVDSQFIYQSSIEESVVLLYDPVKTARGFLSLRAFRLSNLAMKLCKEGEFTSEALKNNKMSFEKFFEEIPIFIRNSHLVNALLCKLDSEMPVEAGKQFMDMGGVQSLEKSLQSLMKCVEETSRWANYNRQQTIRHQQLLARQNRNEPPLTEEEINKILKPLAPLQRFEAFLNYTQTLNFAQQSTAFATQNIGKLFTAKGLAASKDSK